MNDREPEDPSLLEGPLADVSRARVGCANFCRITGTPEELVLDFAQNGEPGEPNTRPLVVRQRVVVSPLTAKRLVAALDSLLARMAAPEHVTAVDAVWQRLSQPDGNPARS